MSGKYKVITVDGRAKRAHLETVHGSVETPVFMNVGTVAAIKGAVSTEDLRRIGTQIELSNTYHLHVRTGDEAIKKLGGLHQFMNWDRPILTDSGGFQVFSLASLRKMYPEMTFYTFPELVMTDRNNTSLCTRKRANGCAATNLRVDFEVRYRADRDYVQNSVDRTTRWLERCKAEMNRLNSLPDTINPQQMLFGINQGAVYDDIRIEHAKRITQLELDGYAVGGLAVGETHEEMYRVLDSTVPYLPVEKPVYLMGVGTPVNIVEGVYRGVDFFDCVYPSRNGRHGHAYTHRGKINLNNARFTYDEAPIEEGCECPACQSFSRAYIHHLFKAKEMLGMRLLVLHNLYFYNHLMEEIRSAIEEHRYEKFRAEWIDAYQSGEVSS